MRFLRLTLLYGSSFACRCKFWRCGGSRWLRSGHREPVGSGLVTLSESPRVDVHELRLHLHPLPSLPDEVECLALELTA